MSARFLRAALLAAGLITAVPAAAEDAVPVRARIFKGSRQGPAAIDPRLSDLQTQLGHLAYVRWDQVGESQANMTTGKPLQLQLPDGSGLELILIEVQRDKVTFQVNVPANRTHSRVTISKDKRIVHQVTAEKGGAAYFVSIRPWP